MGGGGFILGWIYPILYEFLITKYRIIIRAKLKKYGKEYNFRWLYSGIKPIFVLLNGVYFLAIPFFFDFFGLSFRIYAFLFFLGLFINGYKLIKGKKKMGK